MSEFPGTFLKVVGEEVGEDFETPCFVGRFLGHETQFREMSVKLEALASQKAAPISRSCFGKGLAKLSGGGAATPFCLGEEFAGDFFSEGLAFFGEGDGFGFTDGVGDEALFVEAVADVPVEGFPDALVTGGLSPGVDEEEGEGGLVDFSLVVVHGSG